jgi:UDP-glucuronate 4-epimerase
VKKILVTGAAGFIGFHLCKQLLSEGYEVTGVDIINDYYDVSLKRARLMQLGIECNEMGKIVKSELFKFDFIQSDICGDIVSNLMSSSYYDGVVHLAAQAGVRYSLEHPRAYISSNIDGFLSVLEACRFHKPKHLVYASSSSVYGLNGSIPHCTHYSASHPISLYAATKRSNELMAHSYSHLFGIPTTGLRFFTAYGPWGRPDMALFIFTKAILEGRPVELYNEGKMRRDFTYIDDIVRGIIQVLLRPAAPSSDWDSMQPVPDISSAPFRILNIGISDPTDLIDYVKEIEKNLGKKADIKYMPIQPGDVPVSFANVTPLSEEYGYTPRVKVGEGVKSFVSWYLSYYA